MEHLLGRKLTGNRQTRVKEHTQRARHIAAIIWTRFQAGPYQYQLKHLKWYLDTKTQHLAHSTRYRHWLTTKNILYALNKDPDWTGQLQGSWITPVNIQDDKK